MLPERPEDSFRERLARTVITEPLLGKINENPTQLYAVIIVANADFQGGQQAAFGRIRNLAQRAIANSLTSTPNLVQVVNPPREGSTHGNLFAMLSGYAIRLLVELDRHDGDGSPLRPGQGAAPYVAIYQIWEDTKVKPLITRSVATVKADAAHIAFSARGRDVVWAILDSGIDHKHMHFEQYRNLELPAPLAHANFTSNSVADPLADSFGHGTHVAGIVAGAMDNDGRPTAAVRIRDETGSTGYEMRALEAISGMAPECKLVSYKVLQDDGTGLVSSIIDAIDAIQIANNHGRRILIHGVNLSVGYEFDPEWFACGQSPLCVEINRLVKSGVVVVAAAGNTGYGWTQSMFQGPVAACLGYSINDPGNAELAITVGSTHREMPHVYGVSYFSSKGPTGDGRRKPDLVAPGERIISCATGKLWLDAQQAALNQGSFQYTEDSGTSMAAPHVSGVIAAFLSVRREYIGQPEQVKHIFLETATDLKRDPLFQGAGLVDLMRAIQSV
jgi:serine protease AprX